MMTMQIARLIAMTMVNIVLKGAGQHSGPQGVETVDVAGKKRICISIFFFASDSIINPLYFFFNIKQQKVAIHK